VLRMHLLHADAMILLRHSVEAALEIRYVLSVARREKVSIEPGRAEFLLARALAEAGEVEALEYARKSLVIRQKYYSPDSRQVRESRLLVAALEWT
jgi:SpoVK/Ycf46/Vps4 family AAA+-type ATPase